MPEFQKWDPDSRLWVMLGGSTKECMGYGFLLVLRYSIVGFNDPLDTLQVISKTKSKT